MIKRLTVWGVAVVAVIVALRVVMRAGPEGAPDVVEVLDQAPLPLPAGQRVGIDDLQRQVQLTQELTSDDGAREPLAADTQAGEPPRVSDGSRRFVFDCGNGVVFAVRTVPGAATVSSPQALGSEVITLPEVEAASGERYAFGDVEFRSRGGLVSFEVRERTFGDCTSNPDAAPTAEARRRSATFRASGNGPAWLLEVAPAAITLSTELGRSRTEFPYRAPEISGARTTYRAFAGTQELVVVVDRMPCNDTISGEAFDSTVAVTFEGTTLYGCGQIP